MQPLRYTYTPAAEDLTRFGASVTGASWTLTETTTSDGLAHKVTIQNETATDHSGKTVVLTGQNADGNTISETVALPGPSDTVESTYYFKTLTSPLVPSATIDADTMNIGQGSGLISQTIPLSYLDGGIVGYDVIVSGTVNYTVQYTDSDITSFSDFDYDWIDSPDANVQNATDTQSSNFTAVPVAMRILFNSQSGDPTVKFYITQNGNGGGL